jgi:hypothetical protein
MAFLQYIGNEHFRTSVTLVRNSPALTEKEKSSNNSSMGKTAARSASEKAMHKQQEEDNPRATMNLNN